jgi:hypothetical protein
VHAGSFEKLLVAEAELLATIFGANEQSFPSVWMLASINCWSLANHRWPETGLWEIDS